MYAYIGRQAIFDGDGQAVGYELLYREGGGGNRAVIRDGSAATREVLSDAVTTFGIPRLTGGKRAFINFTRELLLGDFARLADPEEIVIEVMERVRMDEALAEKFRELREDGYRLALDNYTGALRFDRLLSLFDYVKVDFSRTGGAERRALAQRLKRAGVEMVAEKVESEVDWRQAADLGFRLFQGYYLERPRTLVRQVPALSAASYGRLMDELFKPEADLDACREAILSDVALTYMLLRQVQAGGDGGEDAADGLRAGLEAMGVQQLQRWICLVLLRQSGNSRADALPRRAYLRGRFIQRLMERAQGAPPPREGFLLGMFSLLDQVMGAPMEDLLQDLRLDGELKEALLGRGKNRYAPFLAYAMKYETDEQNPAFPGAGLRLAPREASLLYEKCRTETDRVFGRLGGMG